MPSRPTPNAGILDISPYVGGKSKAKPGVKVVKLSSNESPLGASPKALAAYKEAGETLHRYPDGHAALLREAIADVHKLPMEQIVCGAGSDELIGLLVHGYAKEGDEVLISEHGFLMYKIYAQAVGAKTITAPEKNLRTDVDALLKAVTPRTRIVFVANPNNPTGSYITKDELKRLHAGLPPHVILALDGAYAEYCDQDDYSCGRELAASTDNTVILRTFSKIYGLSALRLGWMFGPAPIIDVINRIRGPFNISAVSIAAGAAAKRDVEFTASVREFNKKWLAWMDKELSALGFTTHPSIANFILVECKDAQQASAANAFLMERGLIVREVANYGLPTCLRITIGLEEDNRAVVKALREFLGT
jgi:histidinol-phosphate aminotransferase